MSFWCWMKIVMPLGIMVFIMGTWAYIVGDLEPFLIAMLVIVGIIGLMVILRYVTFEWFDFCEKMEEKRIKVRNDRREFIR